MKSFSRQNPSTRVKGAPCLHSAETHSRRIQKRRQQGKKFFVKNVKFPQKKFVKTVDTIEVL